MPKQWIIRDPAVPLEVRDAFADIPSPILRALVGRGFDAQRIQSYVQPDYKRDIHDPFLFRDMGKAVERIAQAIQRQERVLIHGDYDADGVTSAAIVASALAAFGLSSTVFLPHRIYDGYGISKSAIEDGEREGVTLLITTDCGIANADEVASARELGIDTIIIDHHERKDELPPAVAIIHPLVDEQYPDKTLTGGGVAFKFLQALVRTDHPVIQAARDAHAARQNQGFSWEGFEKWMLDLVAISTIADCTQLTGESRALVYWGIEVLKKTRRPGLQCLLGAGDRSQVNARTIGFSIAPMLNAAGRMEEASIAYDLIMAEDQDRAQALSQRLNNLNTLRREATDEIIQAASRQINNSIGSAVVAYHPEWQLGVLGIVAARLSETFARPAFVLTRASGKLIGSARAPEGWNVLTLLEHARDALERYGGHSQAGGFTVRSEEHITLFQERLLSFSAPFTQEESHDQLFVDAAMEFEVVSDTILEWLKRCEPFGKGNPPLRFAALDCVVQSSRSFKENKHWELVIRQGAHRRRVVGFGQGTRAKEFKSGEAVDICYEVRENVYQGRRSAECYIVDVREA